MGWEDDFEELANELRDLSQKFESERRRDTETGQFESRDVAYDDKFAALKRIETGTQRALQEEIVPDAKRRASQYVTPAAVNSIQGYSVSWDEHYFGATHELIKYHEYGTGPKARDPNKATINAPSRSGYIIPFEGYPVTSDSGGVYGPDSFPAALEELGPEFQFSVHPGVDDQRFMYKALMRNTDAIEEHIANEFEKFGN